MVPIPISTFRYLISMLAARQAFINVFVVTSGLQLKEVELKKEALIVDDAKV